MATRLICDVYGGIAKARKVCVTVEVVGVEDDPGLFPDVTPEPVNRVVWAGEADLSQRAVDRLVRFCTRGLRRPAGRKIKAG